MTARRMSTFLNLGSSKMCWGLHEQKTSGFNAKLSRMSQGDYDALQPKVAHQQVVFNSTWIRTALSVKAKVKGGEGRSLRSLLQPHTATAWPHSTRWQVDRWYNVEPASSRLVNINTERTTHTERGRIQKNPKVSVLYWFVQEVWVALDRHNEHRLPSGCSYQILQIPDTGRDNPRKVTLDHSVNDNNVNCQGQTHACLALISYICV